MGSAAVIAFPIAPARSGFEQCALQVEAACAEAATASATVSEVVMNVRMAGAMVSQLHHGLDAVVASTDASRRAAVDALAQVVTTDAAIRVLSQLGDEIGAIIATITRVAQQTRMVALNAKIEAVERDDRSLPAAPCSSRGPTVSEDGCGISAR